MRIVRAEATPLFAAITAGPSQIVRVTVAGEPDDPAASGAAPILVRAEGAGVTTREPAVLDGLAPGTEREAEVAVTVAAPHGPGSRLPVTVIAEGPGGRAALDTEIAAAEPGWTIWMVCHFHYDPVWWNTQGSFTQTQLPVPGENGELPDTRAAFELVRLHLAAARDDADYKFVLAEVDYLKPYFDVHPEDRAFLRELLAAGRVELVGGAYNEPNTNLTSAESTIRNIISGLGQQRGVFGADPSVAWALDAFGHDPSYPGLMAAAGMTGSAWARGPYHQWGPRGTVGSNDRMQFPSEFEWISPDGQGLLTSYMANHYGAGWVLHQAADLPAARAAALDQFATLAPVAATRNMLLPVGADHVIPARWATAVHRDFAARYAWPRCVTGLPREFFAAVRAEAAERGIWLTPQTRDMNPVYPGKDVSYIDTKQAQRAAEVAVSDGERLATLAWLAGAEYPAESLDKAWRQLVFGAHHDAITGTESDQVYLDLLGGWREAFERGESARRDAAVFLSGLVDSRQYEGAGAGRDADTWPVVVVVNTLSWPRAGLATSTLAYPEPGPSWVAVCDETGTAVPFLAEAIRRHPGGGLATMRLTFLADVPALGYRTYWAAGVAGPDAGTGPDAGWAPVAGTAIGNEAFEIEADPERGGGLGRILDKRTGTDLLTGLGNELVLADEYGAHPRWGEGPWLLSPKGTGTGSARGPATVSAQRCAIGSRLVAEFALGDLRITQETTLWDGLGRVEFATHVDGSIGTDRLLRVRFPARVPGGLPVYQCATAVVGRPFGVASQDVAEHWFTLDNPAHEWFGLGSAARVRAGGHTWAIGVAEVILPDGPVDHGAARERDAAGRTEPGGGGEAGAASGAGEWSAAGRTEPGGGGEAGAASDGGEWSAAGRTEPGGGGGAGAGARGAGGADGVAGWRAEVRGLVAALAGVGVTATCGRAGGPRYGSIDLDSNLPDFRIAIGGPRTNQWTARLLAALDPATAASLAARLSGAGAVRIWVPAARSRAEVFTAGADVRGERDLPVLIVSGEDGAAALASLTRDLADAVIEADLPDTAGPAGVAAPADGAGSADVAGVADGADPADVAGLPDRLLAAGSVALLNRGTPGSLVTPDGTLHISLMRASTAWPAGVWLDGPRRTVPDGSSFAWQHWSHTFQYAFVAGQGDWRDAGFAVAGQEYNHDLLTVETGQHGGPLPPVASLGEVGTPGARPAVLLSALKPRGNPLAAGQPGRPERDAGVTVRLRDGGQPPGGPAVAEVTLRQGIAAARLTGLTEDGDGAALELTASGARVSVPPAGVVTVAMVPAQDSPSAGAKEQRSGAAGTAERTGSGPDATADLADGVSGLVEPVQPVFTRYWLHGKGPAPAENLPVTVHLSPDRVALGTAGAPGALSLTVAGGPRDTHGTVVLDVPPGLAVTGPGGAACETLAYSVPAGGHARFDLAVRALPGASPGRFFVCSRIVDDLGQMLEDAALITVGGPPGPAAGQPRADLEAAVLAEAAALAAEAEVGLLPAALALPPGGSGTLTVRVANRAASEIRGECQLASPFGTWAQTGPWARGFTAGPGREALLRYPVTLPATARPGAEWWVLAKVMYFGRVRYSECARIQVTG